MLRPDFVLCKPQLSGALRAFGFQNWIATHNVAILINSPRKQSTPLPIVEKGFDCRAACAYASKDRRITWDGRHWTLLTLGVILARLKSVVHLSTHCQQSHRIAAHPLRPAPITPLVQNTRSSPMHDQAHISASCTKDFSRSVRH